MSYPIDSEPNVRVALDEFLKQLGWHILDLHYSLSDEEPLSVEDQQEFNARIKELTTIQHACIAFKKTLWDGVSLDTLPYRLETE